MDDFCPCFFINSFLKFCSKFSFLLAVFLDIVLKAKLLLLSLEEKKRNSYYCFDTFVKQESEPKIKQSGLRGLSRKA